ncbi:hypothetical protein NP493_409g08007 [Ridgeia piscesae]|uniref:Uncharacterized protein n=1 Tax=Ridgeia piscesae TaxID=27915 RepID=A0AAD9NSU9_RIDPI|nr:hypothetical protein NP493_409g08007 [Ridgeia piscesae]
MRCQSIPLSHRCLAVSTRDDSLRSTSQRTTLTHSTGRSWRSNSLLTSKVITFDTVYVTI